MDTKLLEIGHRLCAQRKKKGLTQDALAEKANVSAQTISHAELGKKAMRADTIIGVCGVLEISAAASARVVMESLPSGEMREWTW